MIQAYVNQSVHITLLRLLLTIFSRYYDRYLVHMFTIEY